MIIFQGDITHEEKMLQTMVAIEATTGTTRTKSGGADRLVDTVGISLLQEYLLLNF